MCRERSEDARYVHKPPRFTLPDQWKKRLSQSDNPEEIGIEALKRRMRMSRGGFVGRGVKVVAETLAA